MLEHAARTALAVSVPLVCIMRSSGADIVEGFAALHGWGRAAKALADCSGIVPTIFVVDGPAVSGPALLIGLADLVVMTRDAYAFVSGPTMVADFTGVVVDKYELGGAASHARYTGAASWSPTTWRRRRRWSSSCSATCPSTTTPSRRRGRPTTRSTAGCPRPASSCRRRRRAATTCATSCVRSATTASCSSCAAAGRRTSSPRSPRSAASPSASWPTSRSPWPARSTSRRRRRRRASWRCATRSTCRSSRSSTRPASTRARTSSGGA